MGIIAALLSAFCAAAKDVLSKALAAKVDGTVSTFASFVFALPYYVVLLTIFWFCGLEDFHVAQGFFFWIALRSFSDAFAEWFRMHAFKYGDLSVVSSLISLYPLILLITSPLITGDELTLPGATAVAVTIVGTLIILYRPPGSRSAVSSKAIIFALAAAICFSLNSCFDRLAVQTASPLLSGFALTALAALFILPVMIAKRAHISQLSQYRGLFLQRGFFEIAFMVIKLYALTVLQAPYVVGLQRVSVLFSVISGKVFSRKSTLSGV